jgi:hypothetical protein
MNTFQPSLHGFRFPNHFDEQPILTVTVPLLGEFNLGDASYGLCGGMTFATLDYWKADLPIPTDEEPTPELLDFIKERQIDSLNVPRGLWEVYHWTAHSSDADLKSWTNEEVAKLAELLAEDPVPLMLIKENSRNPVNAAYNHQVLAYYLERTDEENWSLWVYDSNCPCDDEMVLVGDADGITYNSTVRGFYCNRYVAEPPPQDVPQEEAPPQLH